MAWKEGRSGIVGLENTGSKIPHCGCGCGGCGCSSFVFYFKARLCTEWKMVMELMELKAERMSQQKFYAA